MSILAHKPNKDLAFLTELLEAGKVKPIIDRCYPLSEVADAFRYFGEGHAQGKVVITLEGPSLGSGYQEGVKRKL